MRKPRLARAKLGEGNGVHVEIRRQLESVVDNPELWLDTPNDQLGGHKPRELLGTPQERHVRDLLEAIKHGMVS